MKNKIIRYQLLLLFLSPVHASANTGLPMIGLGLPFMILLFIPVLLIESLIYKYKLGKRFWEAFKVAGLANLCTTLIGYPLSWLFLLMYQISLSLLLPGIEKLAPTNLIKNQTIAAASIPFLTPAWFVPFDNYPTDLFVCLAGMVGLIPAYWITVASEKKILRRCWKNGEKTDPVCILSNRISYLLLYLVLIVAYFIIYINKYEIQ